MRTGITLSAGQRDIIRREIAARGMTQRQLAELAGLHQPDVAAMLSGRHSAGMDTWDRLLRSVGYTIDVRLRRLDEERKRFWKGEAMDDEALSTISHRVSEFILKLGATCTCRLCAIWRDEAEKVPRFTIQGDPESLRRFLDAFRRHYLGLQLTKLRCLDDHGSQTIDIQVNWPTKQQGRW